MSPTLLIKLVLFLISFISIRAFIFTPYRIPLKSLISHSSITGKSLRVYLHNDEDNLNNAEETYTTKNISPDGYLNTDFNSIADGKKTRVLVYIVLALLPCLLLVPFFLSRDFIPPVDPSEMLQ